LEKREGREDQVVQSLQNHTESRERKEEGIEFNSTLKDDQITSKSTGLL